MSAYERKEAVLASDDFPWRRKADCEGDYLVASAPMHPESIIHSVRDRPDRLWLRVSWKLSEGKFVPMSFLLDMGYLGYPKHLYLSQRAIDMLEHARLIGVDADTDVEYTTLFGRKCCVELTPSVNQPANIIGLKMLHRLGLQLSEVSGYPHFTFATPFQYFSADGSGIEAA